jgi:predicted amidohydrolase
MSVRVAVAQLAPVVLDLEGCVDKACDAIARASKQRVKLLAFPETWVPVYPFWCDRAGFSKWDDESGKRLHARLYKNSLEVGSKPFRRLQAAIKKGKLYVVLGANERAGRSLYNTLFFFNDRGDLVGHHRKLVPTFGERLVWGYGDGYGLQVHDTPFGKLGGLVCWEHWMPPARQALHELSETIHVAAWPSASVMHQTASVHYAFEGRCFVLVSASYLEKKMLPADYDLGADMRDAPEVILNGGSAVIGPNGKYVVEPVFGREELIVADIDPERVFAENLTLDVAGHYSRPDVFELTVNRKRKGVTTPATS